MMGSAMTLNEPPRVDVGKNEMSDAMHTRPSCGPETLLR